MKRVIWVLLTVSLSLSIFSVEPGEKKKPEDNTQKEYYSKTPKDYRPFGNFKKPYKDFFDVPLEYTGYGRHIPEPDDLDCVKIGFLGPIEPTVSVATGGGGHEIPLGKKMLQGATLAIEHANEIGGYIKRNIPYKLIVRNDNGLWGASGNEVVHLAYKEKVWAILGTIDGANSHIGIRVALKAEVPMVSPGDTDPTFSETSIPWAFRTISDDRQMCYLLADYVFKKRGFSKVAALRANNRYGRISIDEFRDAATRLGHPFVTEINYLIGDTDFTSQLETIKALDPDVIITYGGWKESALILKQMREKGMNQLFIGSDRMVTSEFLDTVGDNPGEIVAGYPYNPENNTLRQNKFKNAFYKRFGEMPETYAAHAYDGMTMIIKAIERGGLNRAKIRDELAAMTKYNGVTGILEFNHVLSCVSSACLAVIEEGKWVFKTHDEALK